MAVTNSTSVMENLKETSILPQAIADVLGKDGALKRVHRCNLLAQLATWHHVIQVDGKVHMLRVAHVGRVDGNYVIAIGVRTMRGIKVGITHPDLKPKRNVACRSSAGVGAIHRSHARFDHVNHA